MQIVDLSGKWAYKTDYDDCGITNRYYEEKFEAGGFVLPGSTCENGIGKKQEYFDELTKEAARAPRERYEYIGPLWLQRDIEIPKELEGKCVRLFLERVNIASELWIDGKKAGRQIIELSAPHIYHLTGRLTAGMHTLTLRIDNRNLLNFGDMASGYSIDTQGYWNGIVGRIELQYEEMFHMENLQVYPGERGIRVQITFASDIWRPSHRYHTKTKLYVTTPDGDRLVSRNFERVMFNSRQVECFDYEIDDIQPWNEFTPNLYTLTVKTVSKDNEDEKSVRFGMRTIKVKDKKIFLGDRQLSLRGTIDCAQYPITGYPSFDIELWRKNFRTIKSYGLNHVRFHAWCPPECAFEAADETGLYLSVEMPLWINKDVMPLEYGDDPIHDQYYQGEARTISKVYGNHPSFVMFSNGNETMGNFELLSDITKQMRAYDTRRIYTITSNFDHPVMDCEDYLCAFEVYGNRIRIQTFHDTVAEHTCLDYAKAVADSPVPIISFEVGQYCSYPDVDICEKYTGNMLPVNFDAIRKHMIKKEIYPRLKEYIAASGDLAARLYKEDIEAALRTRDFGGFELLSLIDYTGQSTATVGILDVFYESKGIITPDRFRQFCNHVVPLFKAKRIYKNTDILEAELDLYDYGPEKISEPEYHLKIYNGNEIVYEEITMAQAVSVPLDKISKASMLTVVLSVGEYSNSWQVYVYPEITACVETEMISTAEELYQAIENGESVVVTADVLKNSMKGSFVPVFWSPVHFPTTAPSGEIIDSAHPLFDDFPTGNYPDYQWKALLDHSQNADISHMRGLKPIVEVVPNFVDAAKVSPLFEMRIGKAKVLFCGFDLSQTDLPTVQLKNCIYNYINSARFYPACAVDIEVVKSLFK